LTSLNGRYNGWPRDDCRTLHIADITETLTVNVSRRRLTVDVAIICIVCTLPVDKKKIHSLLRTEEVN